MADAKISALTELAVPPAVDDEFVIVDKDDTSEAASGTDKRIKQQTLDQAVALATTGLTPTGVTYQNVPRVGGGMAATIGPTGTGVLRLCAIWLPGGFTVNNVSHLSGTTGLTTSGTGPHFWVALYDSARGLLRQSNDDTAATWSASTLKTVNLSSAFVTTYTGLHYLGLMVAHGSTGTPPTLAGAAASVSTVIGLPPIISGTSTTGLTTTAPDPAGALTAITGVPYCGIG